MVTTYDERERWNDPEEQTRMSQDSHQARMWTAMPVIIKKHDRDTNTAHVQITVKQKHVDAEGKVEWLEIPMLKDVPVHYPGAGGVSITNPLKEGDEGLIMFASRDYDNWWKEGGVQEQREYRPHDLSNGFVMAGFRSQPRKLKNISEKTWQLRTDEENPEQVVDFDPDKKTFSIKSPNPVTIDAPSLRCTGEIIAKYNGDNIHLSTHTHGQPVDSHGDTEAETNKPTTGS
jgi:hypothetical protein